MAVNRPISVVSVLSKSVEWEMGLNSAIMIAIFRWQSDPKEEKYFNMESSKYLQSRIQAFQV